MLYYLLPPSHWWLLGLCVRLIEFAKVVLFAAAVALVAVKACIFVVVIELFSVAT